MPQTVRPFAYVLAVQDLERSAAYYRDVLEFRVLWEDVEGWRLVERDGVRVMLGDCPTDRPTSELGSHSWFAYLEADDVDALRAEIAARGGNCSAPHVTPYGMREIVVTTLDGHRIVFGQRDARSRP